MKRSVSSCLLVSAVVLGICATFVSPALGAKKKIRFWVENLYTWREIAAKFEKENPNVDVEVVSGDLDKLYAMITAGMMPDVWGPWNTPGITADVNRNWALDLTPYIARDGKQMNIGDFFPGLMRQFKVKGRQYSLPIFYYVDWFVYDTQKYAQAGLAMPPIDPKDRSWTWERMVANAQKTTKYNTRGQVDQPGLEFSRTFDNCNWTKLWGASLYDAEGLRTSIPQRIYFTTSEMVTALTKAWELIYKYKVSSPAQIGFASKKCAASIECGWNVSRNVMKLKNYKWALAPLPYGVTNAGTTYPDGWRISRICKDKELVWKFVKFLSSPESMKIIVRDDKSDFKGSGVARKSVFNQTMAQDIGNIAGMRASDVMQIYEGADDVGIVQDRETICLHVDITRTYLDSILNDLWSNKMSPREASVRLQNQADKAMPVLFQRWLRNVKFTGADKVK
jgi:ABC-type glycerol-3-phosphate transport system substrate-binding protein